MIKFKMPTLTIGMILSIVVALVFSLLTGIIISRLLNHLRERTYLAVAKVMTESPDFEHNLQKVTQYIVPSSRSEYPIWVFDPHGNIRFTNRTEPPSEILMAHFHEMSDAPKNTYNEIILSLNPFTTRYVLVNPADSDLIVGFRDDRKGPIVRLSVIVVTAVFISCFFVYLASIAAMIFYLKRKSLMIDKTLMEIEKGNLSARVPLSKFDRSSGLIPIFNQMADKLQVVGEKLRTYEQERLLVLQEIAHDLRTPLTSLTGASETLMYSQNLPPVSQRNLLNVISGESLYLSKLIEDLFFLAEIQARRGPTTETINLADLVNIEIQKLQATSSHLPTIHVQTKNYAGALLKIDSVLAKRLISNLLENALNAKARTINIEVAEKKRLLLLKVWNDGQLPSEEQIRQYGQKKKSRTFTADGFKGSLGLGSVIVRSIVESHQGHLRLRTTTSPEGFEVSVAFRLS
ncbi:MAG: hypothetical protein OM95_13585 [Bdellovibrio sp. ArHS]|uniref:sensor histidine kinase n=1 Tax=Bdellovibrio sp. ArHS TaxID=1569284 RepID=UPI0005832881|nr:sensor histidine kinase [Bdellovibrio sp. ArHS]KHD87613.1 MAG: hypothetical protein OM95_13585 [Bdellovibrio sp. ArHS]